MEITIVGSGHGGCAMAAVQAMRGHEVNLIKLSSAIHNENFALLRQRRTIHLSGLEGSGEFPLGKVTSEPSEAIPDAELVLVFYVANYHPMVAERLSPYLHSNQCVVLNPGYGGSLLFEKALKAADNDSTPLFAEFETLPYSCRINAPGSVQIDSLNVRHPFAAYPISRSQEFIDRFSSVLGECPPRRHLLEVALHNPNLLIHTIGVLLNVTLVESEDQSYHMYRDGFPPIMWNLIGRLDEEKMDVLEKLGAPRVPYFDEFRVRTFREDDVDTQAGFAHYASEAPGGPYSVDHRYVTEDVPMGLVLLHSLAKATGVRTPICDSLVNIANGFLPEHDFWSEGRTLESLWDGTVEELLGALTR
jgi:opine dehydrogenase